MPTQRPITDKLLSFFTNRGKKKVSQAATQDTLPRSRSETYMLNKLAVDLEVFDRLDVIESMKKPNKTDFDCLQYLYWLLMYKRRDFFFPDPPPYFDPGCSAEASRPSQQNNLGTC